MKNFINNNFKEIIIFLIITMNLLIIISLFKIESFNFTTIFTGLGAIGTIIIGIYANELLKEQEKARQTQNKRTALLESFYALEEAFTDIIRTGTISSTTSGIVWKCRKQAILELPKDIEDFIAKIDEMITEYQKIKSKTEIPYHLDEIQKKEIFTILAQKKKELLTFIGNTELIPIYKRYLKIEYKTKD